MSVRRVEGVCRVRRSVEVEVGGGGRPAGTPSEREDTLKL